MMITNASQARAWLAAWSGAPRKGIRAAAIQGLESAVAISRSAGANIAEKDYREAIGILKQI